MPNDPALDDDSSVRDWLASWQTFIRARDFAQARRLFMPGVLGFGSVATVAGSLDDLEGAQWRRVWPKLGSFAFQDEHLAVTVSSDRLLAAVAVTWASTWTDETPNDARSSGHGPVGPRSCWCGTPSPTRGGRCTRTSR